MSWLLCRFRTIFRTATVGLFDQSRSPSADGCVFAGSSAIAARKDHRHLPATSADAFGAEGMQLTPSPSSRR
jgi:hypothetical protein